MSIRFTRKQWLDSNKKPEDRRTAEEKKADKQKNRTTQLRKHPRRVRFRNFVQAVEQQMVDGQVVANKRVLEAVARRASAASSREEGRQ
jgi:hypothetical protein